MIFANKEPITIVGGIPTSTAQTFKEELEASGEITGIWVSTYVGQEFDLQYTFEMSENVNGPWENILEPLDKNFVAGNGEVMDFAVRREFSKGDYIKVTVENEDSNNAYTKNAMVNVDYQKTSDIIGGIMEVLGV